jgi:ATP-dependent DNA helicase RecG
MNVTDAHQLIDAIRSGQFEEAQSTRNQLLMRLLQELGLVENRGSGIRAMLTVMREAHLEPPRFQDTRNYFQVVFKNTSLMSPEAVQWLNRFGGYPLNDNQRMALVYLRNNEEMSNGDYRRLNNVSDTTQATRELKRLVDHKLIEMHASRRWATYSLSKSLATEPAEAPPTQHEQVVLRYVREKGSISSGECQRLLDLRPRQASYLLSHMRKLGLLRQVGGRRWARYELA